MNTFDATYWERHWRGADHGSAQNLPANPYLASETADLPIGTALDSGCGRGTEAIWLAERGWRVTGADISATALADAADRADRAGLITPIEWVKADLERWEPDRTWDLVTTHYAHPKAGQLDFYQRISKWVAPGGTLLIVGHLPGDHHHHSAPGEGQDPSAPSDTHRHGAPGNHQRDDASGDHQHPGAPALGETHDHGEVGPQHAHPEAATATLAGIREQFAGPGWQLDAGYEHTRTVYPGPPPVQLADVVVRLRRSD